MALLTTSEPVAPEGVRTARRVDIWTWFALFVAALLWPSVGKPISDPDIWWHVRAGELILNEGIPRHEPWAFTALDRPWVMTAWASDVVLAATHEAFGWWGIVVLKLVLSALVLAGLARLLFRLGTSRVAAPTFVLCTLVLTPFLGERPQLVSLLFVIWLVALCHRALTDAMAVPWFVVPLTYLWANLHGMWVLVPVSLMVVALGQVIDLEEGWRHRARRTVIIAACSAVVAALTPIGPKLVYWPFIVRDAASDISEWQPTVLADRYGLMFLAIFLLWGVAVGRSREPVRRSELLWMAFVLVFSLQAGRNVAPAVILAAPFTVAALERVYGPRLQRLKAPTLPRLVAPATLALSVSGAVLFATAQGPTVKGAPFELVEYLRDRPGTVKVMNTYNVGGFLTGLGAPEVSVAIDGRTDNYDPEFVHRYLAATSHLVQWRKIVEEFKPDVAVVGRGSVLATEMRSDGWARVFADHDFVVLQPPANQ